MAFHLTIPVVWRIVIVSSFLTCSVIKDGGPLSLFYFDLEGPDAGVRDAQGRHFGSLVAARIEATREARALIASWVRAGDLGLRPVITIGGEARGVQDEIRFADAVKVRIGWAAGTISG